MSRVPVICLPYAGAGASFFRPWRNEAPERLHIVPVQLPAREDRIDEEPYQDIAEAVEDLLPEVRELAERSPRVAVFGHSLGAVLAYELTRRLAETVDPARLRLVVSGSTSPRQPRQQRATGLPDEAFLARVLDFAGYDHPGLADAEIRGLVLPMLRADVEMHENYRPDRVEPLPLAVTSVYAAHDHLVSREQAADWQCVTTGPLRLVEMDGGHMYLVDSAKDVLAVLDEATAD